VNKLTTYSNNLQEVVDVHIEEGLKANFKIAILKKHLKMEKVDKEKLLDRLSELNDDAFTPKYQQDI
jgi:hypothetical protein